MDFWNIAVTGSTFTAPLAAILFFALKGRGLPESETKFGLALFGLAAFVAAIGVFRFDHPIRIEFLWPLTTEPSGYFEFSLQVLWIRYVWIFFSAAVFLGFMVFDGPGALAGESRTLRFLFLVGAFLFSALAFLSENALLSLMFVEITVFLLHAFGVGMGGAEGEHERASYFKRSCFLFLSLVTLLAISATKMFSTGSIVLLGAVLYVISLVFSRHNFTDWRYLGLTLVQLGAALFLLGQVTHEEVMAEVAMPLTGVFGLAVASFAAFSILSAGSLDASLWLVLTILGYVLYLRFGSAKPADPFWGAFEAVALAASYAFCSCLRLGGRLDLFWKRAAAFLLMALLLAIVTGAVPGLESASTRFEGEVPLARALGLGLLTFLVAAAVGKALVFSFQEGREKNAGGGLAACLAPGVLVLAFQAGAMIRHGDLYGEPLFGLDALSLAYDLRVLITACGLVLGLLTGALLGANSGFAGWIRNRGKRMEDLFPAIDPAIIHWNQDLVHAPERGLERLSARLQLVTARGAEVLERLDRGVFGERLFSGFAEYGSSLSLLLRFFHSGSVRLYMFLGVLVTLFASFLFLLEGK